MIVREHQTLAAALNHRLHDLSEREIDVRHAAIKAFEIETVGPLIDMGNPQALACWVAPQPTVIEKTAGSVDPIKPEAIGKRWGQHPRSTAVLQIGSDEIASDLDIRFGHPTDAVAPATMMLQPLDVCNAWKADIAMQAGTSGFLPDRCVVDSP